MCIRDSDYGEGSSAADDLEIAYAAIDARDLSEDELRAVADCSFVFEDDANAADVYKRQCLHGMG